MKSSFLSLVLMGICQFFLANGAAQEPAYLHYDVSDGLPSALVYCSMQDYNGFMWFGTDKGLVRFDGTRFKVFGMKDGLPDQEVINLFEDSQDRLWLSCFGKTPAYIKNGKIVTAANDSLLSGIKMAGGFAFFEDPQKRIWITTRDSTYYCLTDNKLITFKANTSVHKLGVIGDELFIFGFWHIYRVLPAKSTKSNSSAPSKNITETIQIEQVYDLLKEMKIGFMSDSGFVSKFRYVNILASGNRVLYGYSDATRMLEYDGNKFRDIGQNKELTGTATFAEKSGRFWMPLSNGGVMQIGFDNDCLKNGKLFLLGRKVSCVMEDKEHNIWFATLNDGIYVLPNNSAQTYKGMPFLSDNLTTFCRLSNGILTVGDDNGYLYFLRKKGWEPFHLEGFTGYNRIRQILALPDNQWGAVTDKAVFTEKNGILIPNISRGSYKSATVKESELWVGTSSHLIKWNATYDSSENIRFGRTTVVNTDIENNVWLGGMDGLYSERDGFVKNFGTIFPPLASRIIDIEIASKDGLWVATPDNGLLYVSIKKGAVTNVEVINNKLAKPIENLQSIFVEDNGTVWLATNKGVISVDKDWNTKLYDQTNGLASNDVNDIFVDNDTLWVGTTSGLSKLLLKVQGETGDFPSRIVGAHYLYENERRQFDFSLDEIGSHLITIPAGSTMLELALAGLHYRTRGNLQFEYRTREKLLPIHLFTFGNLFNCIFKNIDEGTIVQGETQNYGVNLTPGRFVCTATAILPSGTRSTQPDQIIITILPYWWQTLWFSLLILAVVAYGIWRMIKARSDYLKLQNTASELQLQAIKSQMNPHFVGNSINAIQQFFYPPDPVKASEYISIFSDLLRRTMTFSEMDFIPFQEELQYVKDYLQMVKLRFGEQFSYEIMGEETIDPSTNFPVMLLQPILENATIHGLSPDTPSELTLKFETQDNFVHCTLTDNGVGINESLRRKSLRPIQRPSKGLHLLEQKVRMLNKIHHVELKVVTTDRQQIDPKTTGTQVFISFLIKNSTERQAKK